MRSINVWLGGRSYRIRTAPEQEGTVRAAVKLADQKISEMRGAYAGRDDQDFIAMVLLLYATQAATGDGANNPVVEAQINGMIEKLDAALNAEDPESPGPKG